MEINTREELERSFRKSMARSKGYLFIEILCIALYFGLYFFTSDEVLKKYILLFAEIGLGMWFIVIFFGIYTYRLLSKRIDKYPGEKIGNYSKQEIIDLIRSVLQEYKKKEIPAIYILKLNMLNAITTDTYLVNFFKPFNAIYITEPMFTYMTKDEIKAILYHELGHFYQYIYADMRFKITSFLGMFMPFAFTVLVPGIFFKVIFILAVIIWGVVYLNIKGSRNEHETEHLSDLYAAEKAGKLNLINALIIMGKKNSEINKADNTVKKTVKKVVAKPARVLIDWSVFDKYIADSKIQPEEYNEFIQTIMIEKEARVLDAEIDEDCSTHPSLTKRILFLHHSGV